jgi:putative Holliday junction resolvase
MERRSRAEDFARIASLVREHDVDTLVVGLPLNMDGSQGAQARRVRRYARRMSSAFVEMGLEVELVLWDERLSTEEASRIQNRPDNGLPGRGHGIDAIAASVILQSYLDREATSNGAGMVL